MINNGVALNHCIYGRKGEWPGMKKESNRGRNKEADHKGRHNVVKLLGCGVRKIHVKSKSRNKTNREEREKCKFLG